jgi:type IV fimbrial biogenesis protein FimT
MVMPGLTAVHGHFRPARGFTLLEMMVVLVIAVILAGIAGPSFTRMIAAQRVRSAGTDVYAALLKARSEAIKRNASVTLAPKAGGWQNGWQIINPALASNILEDHGAVSGIAISGPASVVYRPSGRLQAGSAAAVVVSAGSGATAVYHCVSVELSGQPYARKAPSC